MSEPRMQKAALASSLFKIGALRFGRFTLASGKTSSYYLNLRVVPSDPKVYSFVIQAYRRLAESVGKSEFDVVAGVATAGIAFSAPLAFLLEKPMVYVRSEEKGHGLGGLVEGAVSPGFRALMVDDLVTTGGSMLLAVEALRRVGCRVDDALVLVDRQEGGAPNLLRKGVRLHAFANVRELADVIYRSKKVTKKEYGAVLRQVEGAA
ncbi:MAG TPA: orotate phosphoribosyltransferase [Nitrososphaerales archaeon]|nr:orotate phosphoribosyltransferase [Nitrososphaerales archaeon]